MNDRINVEVILQFNNGQDLCPLQRRHFAIWSYDLYTCHVTIVHAHGTNGLPILHPIVLAAENFL